MQKLDLQLSAAVQQALQIAAGLEPSAGAALQSVLGDIATHTGAEAVFCVDTHQAAQAAASDDPWNSPKILIAANVQDDPFSPAARLGVLVPDLRFFAKLPVCNSASGNTFLILASANELPDFNPETAELAQSIQVLATHLMTRQAEACEDQSTDDHQIPTARLLRGLKRSPLIDSALVALSEGVLLLSPSGRIQLHNPAAEQILGRKLASADTQHLSELGLEFVDPLDPDQPAFNPFLENLGFETSRRNIIAAMPGDEPGQVRELIINREPVVDPDQQTALATYFCFVERLPQSPTEDVWSEAFKGLDAGIAVFDDNQRLIACNPAAQKTYGVANTTTGSTFSSMIDGALNDGRIVDTIDFPGDMQAWRTSRVVAPGTVTESTVVRTLDQRHVRIDQHRTTQGHLVELHTDVSMLQTHSSTLDNLIAHYPNGIAYFDDDLQLSRYNQNFVDLLSLPRSFLNNDPTLTDFVRLNVDRGEYGPGDPNLLTSEVLERILHQPDVVRERVQTDGKVLEIRGTPISGAGLLATFTDVTERKVIESRLIENEQRAKARSEELEITLSNMNQGVSVFDADGRLQLWNQQYIQMFGKSENEVYAGASIKDLLGFEKNRGEFDGDVDQYTEELASRLAAGETVRTRIQLSSGRTILAVQAPKPGGGWIGTHDDITDQEKASARIIYAAHHDTLTGLANRSLFNVKMKRAVQRAREGISEQFLMLVDLDRFKTINDNFGHAAGDFVLQQAADRLSDCTRPSDLVARLGGDEFAILLDQVDDGFENAAQVALRIIDQFNRDFVFEGNHISIGASVGVASINAKDPDVENVLSNADQALYKVKETGRNGFRFYDDEISNERHSKLTIQTELRDALKNNELQVLFAPIFDLDRGFATHLDVLMKWEHPEHGTLYSPDIMPIADQCGLSNRVCRHAVSEAIKTAATWPHEVQLCINFHPSRFGNGHLVKHLIDTCEHVGLEPGRLCVGLKESPDVGDNSAVISDLKELGMFGIKLAVSNLGGGHNSWQVLQDVEIDLIIVSPSFIRNFQSTPQRAAVLCAMSNLAEGLGIPIAAAGIDQIDQGKLLKLAGITHGMGDALAAPLSAGDLSFPLMQDQADSDEPTTIEISA